MSGEVAAKAAVYAALLLAMGALAARSSLLPRAALADGEFDRIERALGAVLRGAALVLLVAIVARLVLHTAAAFGWEGALTWRRLRTVAIDSRWGSAWRAQCAGSAVLFAASLLVGRRRRVAWAVATLAAVGAAATMPLVGHAAGATSHVILHTVHIVGGGIWLGTLGVLAVVRGPRGDRAALLRAFTPVALSGAALIVPTGVVAAWLYLDGLGSLATTPYGRLLAIKILLVVATLACGYWNWQRFRRERMDLERVGATAGASEAMALVGLEAALALAIVLVTSVLTETAHP